MFGIDDAILVGAAGSVIGGFLSSQGQKDANKTNMQIAANQMKFQERMDNTKWQRQRKDMIAAGINPMLAVSQGVTSAPQGASTRVENTRGQIPTNISNAVSLMNAKANLDNLKSTNDNIKADTLLKTSQLVSQAKDQALKDSSTALNLQTAQKVVADTNYQNINSQIAGMKRAIAEANLPGEKRRAAIDAGALGAVRDYTNIGAQISGNLMDVLNPVRMLVKSLKPVEEIFTHTKQGDIYSRNTGSVTYSRK